MISVKDCHKQFGALAAVRGINLEIRAGEILGMIGPDGAGKTTFIRLLMGLLHPTTGKIRIMGTTALKSRDHVGYMPQHFSLYPDLSVTENLRFFADLYGVGKQQFQLKKKQLLGFSGLGPFQDRLAGHLSGGMQKKLALASNLFHTPDVLFLDEPTTGVDPISRKELWDLLFRLNEEGMTLVVTTPYMDEAQKCNRVGLMYEGRILKCQPPEELIRDMEDDIIELVTEDLSARKVLQNISGLKNIYPYAGTLHLVLESGKGLPEILKKEIQKRGIPFSSIKKINPSLEDVFLSLMDRSDIG